jgi:hypothetical protein
MDHFTLKRVFRDEAIPEEVFYTVETYFQHYRHILAVLVDCGTDERLYVLNGAQWAVFLKYVERCCVVDEVERL